MQADAEQVIAKLAHRIGQLTAELAVAQTVNEALAQHLEELQIPPGAKGRD